MYIERKKLPAGFRQQPARDASHRVVTVVSGTLHIGFGDSFNESAAMPMTKGHTWTIPARKPYYLWAKEGEVLVQVVSNG
jgi:hypothetical protein